MPSAATDSQPKPPPLNTSPKSASSSNWPDSAATAHTVDHSTSSETGDHDIIPPSHPARTLVLCFDGTGDQFSTEVSETVFESRTIVLTQV